MRVRVIDQRYGTNPEGVEKDAAGNTVRTYDQPLVNKSTGRPLVNGGSFVYPDRDNPDPGKRGKNRQWFPGEVLEIPDAEAAILIRQNPLVLESEQTHLERQQRIRTRSIAKAESAWEIAAAMEQSSADDEAARRLRAMQEQKRIEELRRAQEAMGGGSSEKDALLTRLLSQLENQNKANEEQRRRLEEQDRRIEELATALNRKKPGPKPRSEAA